MMTPDKADYGSSPDRAKFSSSDCDGQTDQAAFLGFKGWEASGVWLKLRVASWISEPEVEQTAPLFWYHRKAIRSRSNHVLPLC